MEISSSFPPITPLVQTRREEPSIDFRDEQALRIALHQQLESLQKRWPQTIDLTQVRLLQTASNQLTLRTKEVEIVFSDMERVEKELSKLLEEQHLSCGKLNKKLDEAAYVSSWQSSLSTVSTALSFGTALTIGGIPAVIAAGIALAQLSHQLATESGLYTKVGEQLGGTEAEKQQTGQAIKQGLGFLCMTLSLANLFLGGGSALEKSFKEASQMAFDGTSLFTNVAQNFVRIKQARVHTEKTEIDIDLQGVQFTLSIRHLDQEELQERYESSLLASEKSIEQTLNMLKISQDIQQTIGRGI